MSKTLSSVAHELSSTFTGEDLSFKDISIDTRNLTKNSLFIALNGNHFNGNDFIYDAEKSGAAGAIVSRKSNSILPQIEVKDTKLALGTLAKAWRKNFDLPVIAITGSNGKTTVKELVSNIIKQSNNICVTKENYNNEIGLPITLMGLKEKDEVLILELGANHSGEISYLSSIAKPTIGLITNASASHLEGFGSIHDVAKAKGELLDHLSQDKGFAIINADDHFCDYWLKRSNAKNKLTFGLSSSANCSISGEIQYIDDHSCFTISLPDNNLIDIHLPLPGIHNIINALAAALVSYVSDISSEEIAYGLSNIKPVKGRLFKISGKNGSVIIDDTYNANPVSSKAAIDYLSGFSQKRILVFGNMAELGSNKKKFHSEIGEYARNKCDLLFAIGDLAKLASDSFGKGSESFDDELVLASKIESCLDENVVVLVKGSRFMKMEKIIDQLTNKNKEKNENLL
jgi:UDP-N-acetylmuramoyl-tripeptide--D-alanyl-D-alanine ligase